MSGTREAVDLVEARQQIAEIEKALRATERTIGEAERIGVTSIVMGGHAQLRKAHYAATQFNANLRKELGAQHFEELTAAPPLLPAKKSRKAGR